MTLRLLAATEALAEILERENEALTALDLSAAVVLYPRKQAATLAFNDARERTTESIETLLDDEQKRLARELAERLRALAEENKRLLERAINVQAHVLGTIGRAVARAAPSAQPPRYGASGGIAAASRQRPVILSSRA
jgi:flagellar biosynthesis/type III secretory pathway chaperone